MKWIEAPTSWSTQKFAALRADRPVVGDLALLPDGTNGWHTEVPPVRDGYAAVDLLTLTRPWPRRFWTFKMWISYAAPERPLGVVTLPPTAKASDEPLTLHVKFGSKA